MANGLSGRNGLEASGKKRPSSKARGATRARTALRAAVRKRIGGNGSSAQNRSAKPAQPAKGILGAPRSPELAKYLQDHFAGALAGLELARRLAAREPG